MGKNCALGLQYSPRPNSRPRAQFFPIRTSRPVNNIYILQRQKLHLGSNAKTENTLELSLLLTRSFIFEKSSKNTYMQFSIARLGVSKTQTSKTQTPDPKNSDPRVSRKLRPRKNSDPRVSRKLRPNKQLFLRRK